jgi:hypothetical protein
MSMHNIYILPDQNLSDNRLIVPVIKHGNKPHNKRPHLQVVKLHSVWVHTNSRSIVIKLVTHEGHLVSSCDETLGQVETVCLYSSKLWYR